MNTRAYTLIAVAMFLAGCSALGIRSGYEQPAYEVVAAPAASVEIRRYAPRVAAEATVSKADRNAAFRLLFAYITGANAPRDQIAMTTPVETAADAAEIAMTAPVETARTARGEMRMRFFLPSGYTVQTAPAPTDARVRIVELPAQTLAVLGFSGRADRDDFESQTKRLVTALSGTPWRPDSAPVSHVYDPPWTLPFLRLNEVAVAVKRTR